MRTGNRLRAAGFGILLLLAVGLTGCGGSEKQKIFDQAQKDLEQGSYTYALAGFEASISNQTSVPLAWRGTGICHLRMGDADTAISDFTMALSGEKVSLALEKDILSYRAAARLQANHLEEALDDCRRLAVIAEPDGDTYFLTGQTLLSMNVYEEASTNFLQCYEADPSYDRAIQIYETYVEKGMEADGTRFLERALEGEAKSAEDHCARGRVYYYMEDYDLARSELIEAQKSGSVEAILLLGMVYMAKGDYSNARAMYIQYISSNTDSAKGYNGLALCDMAEKNYTAALSNLQQGIPFADTEELQSLLYNEVVIYERQLDFATARQKAEEYVEAFPDDEQMQRELTFLKTRTG